MKKFKDEIKKEIFNNSIILSYALSIIIIGIFQFFYKENATLIIGVALSTIILIIIECFKDKNTILSIIPIILMLILGFFQEPINKFLGINVELKENIKNLIIFISFSLSFIALSIRNIKNNHNIHIIEKKVNEEKKQLEETNLNILKQVNNNIDKIQDYIENNSKDAKLKKKIRELKEYLNEEETVSNVKTSLYILGKTENKREFTISEVEKSIIQCYGSKRHRKINAEKSKKEVNKNYKII